MNEFLDSLKGLQFRMPDADSLSRLWPALVELAKDPSSNIPAAILLVAIITIVVLMVGVGIIYALMGSSEDEEQYEYIVVDEAGNPAALPVEAVTQEQARDAQLVEFPKDPLRHQKRFLIVALLFIVLLVVTGVTTRDRSVCTGCHREQPHFTASSSDPHREVACVRCHEGGGSLASLTMMVPVRVAHVVSAVIGADHPVGYVGAASDSCRSCHGGDIGGVLDIADRSLRVSHKEPVEAGAMCLDCHRLDGDGRVSQVTVGMSACLRCHNDVATSAECSVCHTGDVSDAVVAEHTASINNAKLLVPDPDCYSCHDPEPCDSCHGARLPHPPMYVNTHMYDAAVDLWDNGGENCFRCHNDENRPCQRSGCHILSMPEHSTDPTFRQRHRTGMADDGDCDNCHNRLKVFPSTCAMCHPGR